MKTTIKKLLTSESTYVDFKVSLEKIKPKSWLKTVVAFANGLGGTIIFGVDDNRNIIGLEDIHSDSEKISNLIKTKIDPILMFELQPVIFEEKHILLLNISSGKMTPYYYVNDGSRTAFVRIGNESVTAPSYIIHELTLKGKSLSFDALSTRENFDDVSFTLFKSTFFKVTGKRIEGKKDYLSFGMIDGDDNLTYAGLLLSDECDLLQSRVFCTRWIGKSKGKRSINASDDKEYSGNIIMLLKESISFIKSNSKKAWKIEGLNRVEFIDYPEDAVREALVNGFAHRDYGIVGSEVHIDMYDDRLEIVSPGGMYNGKNIQEIDISTIASIRRNPILADVLSRIDYMERRGSGLKRIKESYKDQSLVEFRSNESSFAVILKKQISTEVEILKDIKINEQIISTLTKDEKLIIEFIFNNKEITNKQAVELIGLSPAWVRKIFIDLQDKGMIKACGNGRGRKYILPE